jgi:hypothetical protein
VASSDSDGFYGTTLEELMDVIINEVSTTVEIASEEALLDHAVLRRVVHAVAAQLRDDEATRQWEARERQPGRPGSR